LDPSQLAAEFKKTGYLHIQEGNGKVISLIKPENWTPELGHDWIFLLFDMFQIRTICEAFSEVSLDIVEYASKPTIYHSTPNRVMKSNLVSGGKLKFALIREPNWNRFLFQISQPILVKLDSNEKPTNHIEIPFPLYSPSVKELFLSPDGDVKIIKA
jgi:hypothetical protein